MARVSKREPQPSVSDQVLEPPDTTVLDLLDKPAEQGASCSTGDVHAWGVAGIDLIYLPPVDAVCAPPTAFSASAICRWATEKRRSRSQRAAAAQAAHVKKSQGPRFSP